MLRRMFLFEIVYNGYLHFVVLFIIYCRAWLDVTLLISLFG